MIGWGAIVPERQLLLTYLSEEYSDTKPLAPIDETSDASKSK